MLRLSPGWLVALCAAILSIAVWLPWLTTRAAGGGRANALGGVVGNLTLPPHFGAGQLIALLASMLIVAGAMAARGLSARVASSAALAISVLIAVLTAWYYRLFVNGPVAAGYGFYIGAVVTLIAIVLSVWAMVVARASVERQR
jgi:fucose 4-O-acetylase-like acetyltransferase